MTLFGATPAELYHDLTTDFSWVVGLVVIMAGVFGVVSLWYELVIDPREAKVKIAVEQSKKAEMELRRERLKRRRRRKPEAAEVIDDGEHKWEVVEEPPRRKKAADE